MYIFHQSWKKFFKYLVVEIAKVLTIKACYNRRFPFDKNSRTFQTWAIFRNL